jgi:hypothetical protein
MLRSTLRTIADDIDLLDPPRLKDAKVQRPPQGAIEEAAMAQPQPIEAPYISERLSWLEIMERYRYEWLCLVEIEKIDDGLEVHSARVVGRGKTRQEALDDARPFHTQVPTPEHEIAPYFSRPFVHLKR